MKKFISVKLKNHNIVHGFDSANQTIEEYVEVPEWTEKMIDVNRIKSITEKRLLMEYAFGRWIYWEYQGGLEHIKKLLQE